MCREDAPGTDTDKEKMEYSALHRMTLSTSSDSQIRKRTKGDEESNEEEEDKEDEDEVEMEEKSSDTKIDSDEVSVQFDEVKNLLCFFVVYFVYRSNRMMMNK
jgi:hypothetical protein